MGRSGGAKSAKSGSKPAVPFQPCGYPGRAPYNKNDARSWQGDPYPTTHPYMGKHNTTGPKYGNWMPHPYLTDMDTLTKRFGSWTGSHKMEIEPRVNVGNHYGERYRLGMAGLESGQVLYPPLGLCNPTITKPTRQPRHICNTDITRDISEDAKCP
jgi:hypothetical protein